MYIVYFLFQKARNPYFQYHFNTKQTMEKEKTALLYYLIWQWVLWKANAFGEYFFKSKIPIREFAKGNPLREGIFTFSISAQRSQPTNTKILLLSRTLENLSGGWSRSYLARALCKILLAGVLTNYATHNEITT